MMPLLKKDLRLASDALLPWSLIVLGFALLAMLMTAAPRSLRPNMLEAVTMADVLFVAGVLTAMTSVIVACCAGVALVQGDRAHGAAALAASLPLSRWRRCGARLFAMLVAAALPALLASLLLGLAASLGTELDAESAPTSTPWALPGVFAVSVAAAAFGAAVAPWATRMFHAVALALLLAAAICALGYVAGRAVAALAIAQRLSGLGLLSARLADSPELVALVWSATGSAAFNAIANTAVLALGLGVIAPVGRARPRAVIGAVAAFAALAVVSGATAAIVVSSDSELLRRVPQYARYRMSILSNDELVVQMNAAAHPVAGWPFDVLDAVIADEVTGRCSRLPAEVRSNDALFEAMLASESSRASLARLATLRLPREGAERIDLALDVARRHPRESVSAILAIADVAAEAANVAVGPSLSEPPDDARTQRATEIVRSIRAAEAAIAAAAPNFSETADDKWTQRAIWILKSLEETAPARREALARRREWLEAGLNHRVTERFK